MKSARSAGKGRNVRLPAEARPLVVAAVLAAFVGKGCLAADVPDSAALGTSMTPAGAAKSGSADGTIPPWTAVDAQGPGWTWGKRRLDFWKFRGDKAMYSIDTGNVDKYRDKLLEGQVELIKSVKGFRMDVYPTRRVCGMPDFVAANTKRNVGFARLGPDGASLEEAHLPGFPFPIPRNGAEAMWNMKMRYRGIGMELPKITTVVSPRKGGSEWIKPTGDLSLYMPWGAKGDVLFSKVDRMEALTYFGYISPPALAGQAAIVTSQAGQPQETHYYFPGQRRVRRMPAYAYDAPQIGYDNQYTMDEPIVFSGALDRFDWKLVGKREILVPYNGFGLYDFSAKLDEVAQRDFIEPANRRYELHRVWIVEATVKAGVRHLVPKRTVVLDEDSWTPLMAFDYDAQGKLWKVREGYPIPVYETGTCDVSGFIQYNLNDGRYLLDFASLGSGTDIRWLTEAAGNPRMRQDFFMPDNLRTISER